MIRVLLTSAVSAAAGVVVEFYTMQKFLAVSAIGVAMYASYRPIEAAGRRRD